MIVVATNRQRSGGVILKTALCGVLEWEPKKRMIYTWTRIENQNQAVAQRKQPRLKGAASLNIYFSLLTDEVKKCGAIEYRTSKIIDLPNSIGAISLPDGTYWVNPEHETEFIETTTKFQLYKDCLE